MSQANIIVEAELLKTLLKGLNILVNEARFRFEQDGLKVMAVDPANVAMVSVNLPATSCEVYTVDGEEVVVGVNIDGLSDILKLARKRDIAEMIIDDSNLTLRFGCLEYSIALIDPSAIRKEPKEPELELPAKAVLNAGEFKKAIQSADKVTDHIVFRSDSESFYIEAKGDVDAIKVDFRYDLIEHNKAEARSMFSVEYLKEFVRIAGNKDNVTIYLGNDMPLRLHFGVDGGKLEVEYILAPRIETE